jgi:hypothetical protein
MEGELIYCFYKTCWRFLKFKSLRACPRANAELDAVLLLKFEIFMRKRPRISAPPHRHPWEDVAPKPLFLSNKWSDLLSFFLSSFFVVAKHITMVLGHGPKIEAVHKSANASAKYMNTRGRRDAPPNHPHHPPPPTQEKNHGSKIDSYPPTTTSSEEDNNPPSDDESANK